MRIAISAPEHLYKELTENIYSVEWINIDNWQQLSQTDEVAGYFYLQEDAHEKDYTQLTKPIFIGSIYNTLQELHAPKQVCNILSWPTFLQRNTWEIAGHLSDDHLSILHIINKKHISVADEIGLVAARVVSMIINEAYFALEDGVSTKEAIDIAMKLGTNYPYGPFEWADKIGLLPVYTLLHRLSQADTRYKPCSLLVEEATIKITN